MCKIFLSSISLNCIFCCSILKIFPKTIFKFPRCSRCSQFYNAGKNIYLLTIKVKGKTKRFLFFCPVLFLCFPGGAVVKNTHANEETCQWTRDGLSIPGWRRSLEGGNGSPLQYSCPENCMGRGAWWATVQGVTKKQRLLTDWTWARTHTIFFFF